MSFFFLCVKKLLYSFDFPVFSKLLLDHDDAPQLVCISFSFFILQRILFDYLIKILKIYCVKLFSNIS